MSNNCLPPATLQIENLVILYDGKPALDNISLQVPVGSRVAVVGPNGAGKTTLFKALVSLLPISHGSIHIHGEPLGHHLDCVAYVPQKEEVDWRFPITVEDVVTMGKFGKSGWLGAISQSDRRQIHTAMERLRILDLAGRSISELSGGQQQRVFLARAIAQNPHILLMDEPFSGVDAATEESLLELLDELSREKVTIMVATHDLDLALKRFDLTALLNKHLIAFGPSRQVFSEKNIDEVFGKQTINIKGKVVVDHCCPPDKKGQQ
jgi:ABC-type Mn2+/Zn2+ transport system ATPase subunit